MNESPFIYEGKKFTSIEELELCIKEYEAEKFIQLWKRDAKTIEHMRKVCPEKLKNANKRLKYYSLTYACYKGGRKFKSKGKALRSSSTLKNDCGMAIKLALSSDGGNLIVNVFNEDHNHSPNKNEFNALPRQRKLNESDKEEVSHLMKLKCNKKLLQSYIQNKTGKLVQLRDLTNLKASVTCGQNDIVSVVNMLKTQDGATVEVLVNEDNVMLGLFFQDAQMKQCYQAYPELMLLDATYKLINLRMPLYVLMVINGNNEGDVAGVFILSEESTQPISHMINLFKTENPKWTDTKTILTDKDFTEQRVLRGEFPTATQQLCLFHVLKSFRTSIVCEKMNINSKQRQSCLHILQKLAYSKDETEYNTSYEELMNLNLQKVSNYFIKNWHPIKEQWVYCFKRTSLTYNVQTTNHIESFNQKIKQICDKLSNLEDFFKDFITLLACMRSKRQHVATMLSCRKAVTQFPRGSVEDLYMKLLTPFGYELVKNQIGSSTTCDPEITKKSSDFFYWKSLGKNTARIQIVVLAHFM